MHHNTIIINFKVPSSWQELSDKQLRYVFSLLSSELTPDEVKVLCFLHFAGVKVVAPYNDDAHILRCGDREFVATYSQLAELLAALDWITEIPKMPVALEKVCGRQGLPADFQGVPFETFIVAENLFQGFLATRRDDILCELADLLYPKSGWEKILSWLPFCRWKPSTAERISIFYRVASLKEFFAARFSDFFQPVGEGASDGNLLDTSGSGNIGSQLQEAMDAQIRVLTKGDVTKEADILAMDTWRALTELNAQARDYKKLNEQIKSKS